MKPEDLIGKTIAFIRSGRLPTMLITEFDSHGDGPVGAYYSDRWTIGFSDGTVLELTATYDDSGVHCNIIRPGG